jgi:hypothetical protein
MGGVVFLLLLGYLGLKSWIHGPGFRQVLERSTGKSMRAEASFGTLDWSGNSMSTSKFQAHGEELLKGLDSQELGIELNLGGLLDRKVEVEHARIRQIALTLDATAAKKAKLGPDGPAPKDSSGKSQPWYAGLLPQRLLVNDLKIDDSSLDVITKRGVFSSSGTSWVAKSESSGNAYTATGRGGNFRMPWAAAPTMRLEQAKLRYADDTVYLTEADLRLYQSAQLLVTGQMHTKGDGYQFDANLTQVHGEEILPKDWVKHVVGDFDGKFTVRKNGDTPRVEGSIQLKDAQLLALPILDVLAAYADTHRFRRISLQQATTDFVWQDHDLMLKNLRLNSEGLARLEGDIHVAADDRLDGTVRLGIMPGILSTLPGAETLVFQPGDMGLLWAEIHLSGTLKHPREDLSERIIRAAGQRLFEIVPQTGERALKFAEDVLQTQDLPEAARDAIQNLDSPKMIKKANRVVDEVSNVLDIFGGTKKKKDEEKKEQDMNQTPPNDGN